MFQFLIQCYWEHLEQLIVGDRTGSLKDDWLQTNWELIVENGASSDEVVYLQVYGDGADVHSPSSRVTLPSKLPTHHVCCLSKSGGPIKDYLNKELFTLPDKGLPLERLVSMGDDGWYYEKPPFDKVLILSGEIEQVFDLSELTFVVELIHLP